VCSFRFTAVYGKLGNDFAEAHHITPLGKLRDGVKTRVEDLATVCANCHRMLHRMEGRRSDMGRLKAIVRRHLR
jgi:putative restriction endonuclease